MDLRRPGDGALVYSQVERPQVSRGLQPTRSRQTHAHKNERGFARMASTLCAFGLDIVDQYEARGPAVMTISTKIDW